MTAKVMKKEKRKRGGQKGNQNARKHGFYSKVLTEAQMMDFYLAEDVNGIDDEIKLLRVKIKSILENDPENINLIIQATRALARLLSVAYKLDKHNKKGFVEAVTNVLKDVAMPMGIGIGTAIRR